MNDKIHVGCSPVFEQELDNTLSEDFDDAETNQCADQPQSDDAAIMMSSDSELSGESLQSYHDEAPVDLEMDLIQPLEFHDDVQPASEEGTTSPVYHLMPVDLDTGLIQPLVFCDGAQPVFATEVAPPAYCAAPVDLAINLGQPSIFVDDDVVIQDADSMTVAEKTEEQQPVTTAFELPEAGKLSGDRTAKQPVAPAMQDVIPKTEPVGAAKQYFEAVDDAVPVDEYANTFNKTALQSAKKFLASTGKRLQTMRSAKRSDVGKETAYSLAEKIMSRTRILWYEGKLHFYSNKLGYYEEFSGGELRRRVMELVHDEVKKYGGSALFKDALYLLECIPEEAEPVAEHFVCFKNGVLDLNTGGFYGHSPEFFFTYRIEAAYTPHVVCPPAPLLFSAYLAETFNGNQELITRAWQMIGYLLTPDNAGKCFFLLRGVGDSGKSTLGNLISGLFSQNAVEYVDLFRFGEKFSASSLVGKAINLCMDIPNQKIDDRAVGVLKMITGGDGITVEAKYRDAKKTRLRCKILLGSNHPVTLKNRDDAFFNRLVELPFSYTVPKEQRDPDLLKKLFAEKNQIVTYAMWHYFGLRQNGYRFAGVVDHGYCQRPVTDEEVVEAFVEDCCTLDDVNRYAFISDIHKAYLRYCEMKGISAIMNINSFSKKLNHCCGSCISSHKKRRENKPECGYFGITLLDRVEELDKAKKE